MLGTIFETIPDFDNYVQFWDSNYCSKSANVLVKSHFVTKYLKYFWTNIDKKYKTGKTEKVEKKNDSK